MVTLRNGSRIALRASGMTGTAGMTTLQYLDVSKLTCIRGQRVLFRDLSFRAAAGQVLSLEGPNGAGKTSLLRVLAGLLPAAGGTVALVSGSGTQTDADERARKVAWLGHNDAA